MDKQIQALKKLGLTEEEIKDVLETDKRINKGEKLFSLSEEQEKASKKARKSTSVNAYGKKVTRERKANTDKQELINRIIQGIGDVENVQVINDERQLTFNFKEKKYKIVLSCPRS